MVLWQIHDIISQWRSSFWHNSELKKQTIVIGFNTFRLVKLSKLFTISFKKQVKKGISNADF